MDPVGDVPKGSHDIAERAVDRRHQRVVVAPLLHAVGDLTRPRAVRILGIGKHPLPLKAGDVVRHRIEDHLAQHDLQVAALEVAQLRLVLDHHLGTGLLVVAGNTTTSRSTSSSVMTKWSPSSRQGMPKRSQAALNRRHCQPSCYLLSSKPI